MPLKKLDGALPFDYLYLKANPIRDSDLPHIGQPVTFEVQELDEARREVYHVQVSGICDGVLDYRNGPRGREVYVTLSNRVIIKVTTKE
jgi:hypothetical protein